MTAVDRGETARDGDPGTIGVDDHHRGALPFDLDQRGEKGHIRTGGHIGLLAGDHQFVALDPRPGAPGHAGRLGEGEADALVAGQHRQQVRAAQRLAHALKQTRPGAEQARQMAHAVARERLAHDQQRELRHALGLRQRIDAGRLGCRSDPGRGIACRQIRRVAHRGELAGGQAGDTVAQALQFIGQEFGHGTSSGRKETKGPMRAPRHRGRSDHAGAPGPAATGRPGAPGSPAETAGEARRRSGPARGRSGSSR